MFKVTLIKNKNIIKIKNFKILAHLHHHQSFVADWRNFSAATDKKTRQLFDYGNIIINVTSKPNV